MIMEMIKKYISLLVIASVSFIFMTVLIGILIHLIYILYQNGG